jgi:putative Holliday junction resolvase
MARYLGIDLGSKRIGLAVGDTDVGLATSADQIEVGSVIAQQVKAVHACGAEYGVDAYVLGLPLNMDNTEGPQARKTRAFGDALARDTGLPVHYWDERLSSQAADELLAGRDLTHKQKKRRRDRLAAQVILQSFLDAQRHQAEPTG